MSDVRELLPEYALGMLADEDAARVEKAVNDDPSLDNELREVQRAVSSVSFMAPASPAPASSLRDRLLESVGDSGRFLPLLERLAKLFDVTAERAKQYLAVIDDTAAWAPLSPTISFHDFEGGAAVAGSRVGMVRVAAGDEFPMHRHRGREIVLVLQGATQDEGTIYRAGDICTKEDGTAHTTPAIGDQELIYAVVVPNVDIEGIGEA
jgi:hypothetical protein